MSASRKLGATAGGLSIALGALALVSIGPFAQAIVVALLFGLPCALLAFALRARCTGSLGLLALGAATIVNPLLMPWRDGTEYVALLLGTALLLVAIALWLGYRRANAVEQRSRGIS